jgi:predicted permease
MSAPRLARWLLSSAASADERRDVVDDLEEEEAQLEQRVGRREARRWYWRQTWRSLGPLLSRRFDRFERPRFTAHGTWRDAQFALRSLASAPALSLSIVLMIALGIGAHVVVYAVVDGLFLRPMPFGDRSDRLVTLHGTHPTQATDWNDSEISYPDLLDFRRQATTITAVEGFLGRNVAISTSQDSDRVLAASITPGLFSMLGVSPAAGRDFNDGDAADIGVESVVIVSHGFWQSRLGGEPGAVGRSLTINGRPLTVIGVMPKHFSFPDGQQLWLPYRAPDGSGRERRSVLGVGLLGHGVMRTQATQELQSIAARLATTYPATNRDWGVHVMPMREYFVGRSDATTMLGAVTMLLLVVCANVSGLLVARGLGRQRELRLRAALGAGRARLVRLLMIEVLALAVTGGIAGLIVAGWGIRALNAGVPEPPPYWAQPEIDLRVALFAIAVTGLVTMISGLLPALRLSRIDASGALLPGARPSTGTRGHRRLQRGLVVGQIAVTFALLLGAGLLNHSATALLGADGGFDVKPLLSLRVYIAGDKYDPQAARGAVVNETVRRIASIPGVRAVGSTGSIPTDDGGAPIRLVPPGVEAQPDRELGAQMIPAGPTLWNAIGRSLVAGRAFTESEAADPTVRIAIVNERLAKRFWGSESAVDRTLTLADVTGPLKLRVVGVAPDLVYEEFGEETPQSQLNVYVPTAVAGWRTQALLINAASDPGSLTTAVRGAIRAVDPGIAIYDVMTMSDRRAYNHWGNDFLGLTSSAFAIVALLLACIGAYGIGAHAVAQRTREIGLRIALGSTRDAITRLFLGLGGKLALLGVGAGAALGVALARTLAGRGDLFRTSPWSVDVWIGPPVVLVAALMLASYLPARRASRVDPAVTLRSE